MQLYGLNFLNTVWQLKLDCRSWLRTIDIEIKLMLYNGLRIQSVIFLFAYRVIRF